MNARIGAFHGRKKDKMNFLTNRWKREPFQRLKVSREEWVLLKSGHCAT